MNKVMVSKQWFPTKMSAEKLVLAQIECVLNKPLPGLDNRTPYEDTIMHKSASNFFECSSQLQKSPILKYYKDALPLTNKEFSYKSVYSKTGGVLNIINPGIREEADTKLKSLIDKYNDKRKAVSIWKDTPSELWSNLTPKLVWAGGGKIELELLSDYAGELSGAMDGRRFETQGDMIIQSVTLLRRWSFTPNPVCSDMKPIDAIVLERQRIYENKISFLKEMGIETDFS